MNHVVPFIVVIAASSACTESESERTSCRDLDGAIFESAVALPYGETETGTIYQRWHIAFSGVSVDWRHDDVLHDRGTYQCTDDDHESNIRATLGSTALDARYTWDPGDILVWGGHAYVRCQDTVACMQAAGW